MKLQQLNEMRHSDIQYPDYEGGHEHGQDEEEMWEFVEYHVLNGGADEDPQKFIASLRAMIEKRAESQM